MYRRCFGRTAYRPLTEKDMASVSLAGGGEPPKVRDTTRKLTAIFMLDEERNL